MGQINDFYQYTKYIYELVKRRTISLDAVYEDYIINLVGEYGYDSLRRFKLVEGCGSVNGRNLVTIADVNNNTFKYDNRYKDLETMLEK
jgi:hypothetical protein